MSLLMSLLPTSEEFVSEFPSPRVVLSFFLPPAGIALGIMGSTRPSHHVEVIALREGWTLYLLTVPN
jgi:hypothetical protein